MQNSIWALISKFWNKNYWIRYIRPDSTVETTDFLYPDIFKSRINKIRNRVKILIKCPKHITAHGEELKSINSKHVRQKLNKITNWIRFNIRATKKSETSKSVQARAPKNFKCSSNITFCTGFVISLTSLLFRKKKCIKFGRSPSLILVYLNHIKLEW